MFSWKSGRVGSFVGCLFSRVGIVALFAFVLLFVLDTQSCLAADSGTFNCFYHPDWGLGFWGWTTIILFAVSAAVITYCTAGTAAPWMVSVGGWIGGCVGLSGAAATNFGLALLGGGAVAAGGFGIAGGVAVLAAISTFATGVAVDYTIDVATKEWSHQSFIQDSKSMLTLPLPLNETGGERYKGTLHYLQENIDIEKDFTCAKNQNTFSDAINKYYTFNKGTKTWQYEKEEALLALIYFQKSDYSKSREVAREAHKNTTNPQKSTLPMFIWMTSCLYEKNLSQKHWLKNQEIVFTATLEGEPKNQLIPLLYAIYLDRVMYMYHGGKVDQEMLSSLIDIVAKHETLKSTPEVLTIFVARLLTEIKRTQQDILIIDKKVQNPTVDIKAVIEHRFQIHQESIELLGKLLPLLQKYDKKLPKDSLQFHYLNVQNLHDSYSANLPTLQVIINNFKER